MANLVGSKPGCNSAWAVWEPATDSVALNLLQVGHDDGWWRKTSGYLGTKGENPVMPTESDVSTIASAVEDDRRGAQSERVRGGMRAAAQRGFYVFARAPYGYRKVPVRDNGVRRHKLELDPPASTTVRWIFDLRIEGATELEIAAELSASRATPPTVGRWDTRHVRRILGNEAYCGAAVAAKQDMQNPKTAVRTLGAFPAIITTQEFYQVRRME